jgi:hypothetical protein
MTFDNEIEKVKSEIKVLEKKLSLLEEIEKHNAKPKMTLENGDEGSFSIVTYDGVVYYRLEYPYAILWYKRFYKCATDEMRLIQILDLETYRLLEDAWNNEVIVKKDTGPEGLDDIERGEKDNPTEPTRNKYFERILNAPIDERGYVDLREPASEFRQKLFDGIKSVFYDPEYERTHWSVKVNMAVDEVLTHFEDIIPDQCFSTFTKYEAGRNECIAKLKEKIGN